MVTFTYYQPRQGVSLAPQDKIRRRLTLHHPPSIPHSLRIPNVLPVSISSERSGQRARRPTLEGCDGMEVVDLTGPDQEGHTQKCQAAGDGLA